MALKQVTQSLPPAYVGVVYAARLDAVDGDEPQTWALDGASDPLPAGLVLNADGTITGTPTAIPDTYTNLIFEVTDSFPNSLVFTALEMEVRPGAYQRGSAFMMESDVNVVMQRISKEGPQLTAFDLHRHFHRTRDSGAGDPYYLRLLQYLHDSADIQSPAVGALPAGSSVRDAILYLYSSGDNPFTILPDPTGDVTGAQDTAALNAILADPLTEDWLIIPPTNDGTNPYYLNGHLVTNARKFKLQAAAGLTPGSIHFESSAAVLRDIHDIAISKDVGYAVYVRPRFSVGTIEIEGGTIEIDTYELFPEGNGHMRRCDCTLSEFPLTTQLSLTAIDVILEGNRFRGSGAGANDYTVLTADTGVNDIRIFVSNNRFEDDFDGTSVVIDLQNVDASGLAVIGPNMFVSAGVGWVNPIPTLGFAGGLSLAAQATI